MDKTEKYATLLKEVFKELRDIVHLKDDVMPSKEWKERYLFLERLKNHYSKKLDHIKWLKVEESFNNLKEERRLEELKKEKSLNPYLQQQMKENQQESVKQLEIERRENNRRNKKVQKQNVLKTIKDKEGI